MIIHQVSVVKKLFMMSQDELNGLDLSAVCRANNVRAEIVWPPADKHDENSNPYPTRQR